MKVKELLDLIDGVDIESEVFFSMVSGCCGDFEELTINYTESAKIGNRFKDSGIRIEFNSLPGYRSCIQAGSTIKQDTEYWKKTK